MIGSLTLAGWKLLEDKQKIQKRSRRVGKALDDDGKTHYKNMCKCDNDSAIVRKSVV